MRILLVQTSFLGDTVLSTPVIAGIKQLYPQAELWMLTTAVGRELVKNDALLAGVLAYDKRGEDSGVLGLMRFAARLRAMSFDRAYALQRSARTSLLLWWAGVPQRIGFRQAALSFLYHHRLNRDPAQHDVLRNLSILSGETAIESLPQELRLSAPDLQSVQRELGVNLSSSYVVMVPGSVWPTKRWDGQRYREAAIELLRRGNQVLLLGAEAERQVCSQVGDGLSVENLAGKTSLSQMIGLIAHAKLVICNDSMALHIASAFKRPTVTVFCATSPAFGFGPWRNPAAKVVEQEGLACKPCRRHGSRRCPTGTRACMTEVSAARVLAAADKVLEIGSDAS